MAKPTILTFDPFRYASETEAGQMALLACPESSAERIFVNMLAVFNQSVRLTELQGQVDHLYEFKLLGKYLVLEFLNFFELSKKLLCPSKKYPAYKSPLNESISFSQINQDLRRNSQDSRTLNPLDADVAEEFDRVFHKHIRALKTIRNTFTAHSDHNASSGAITASWKHIDLTNLAEVAVIVERFVHEVIRSNPSMQRLTVDGPFCDSEDEMHEYAREQKERRKQYRVGRIVREYLKQDETNPDESGV